MTTEMRRAAPRFATRTSLFRRLRAQVFCAFHKALSGPGQLVSTTMTMRFYRVQFGRRVHEFRFENDKNHPPESPIKGGLSGGLRVKPGEVSLAHLGVLFLDELPEFHSIMAQMGPPKMIDFPLYSMHEGAWTVPTQSPP